MLRARVLAFALALTSCRSSNGTGFVEGDFSITDCRPSGDFEFGHFFFEADRLASERFESSLKIVVGEYSVEIEEADAMVVLIPDVRPLRTATTSPLIIPVQFGEGGVQAALGLHQTCPSRPTLHARTGTLTLSKFQLAEDPRDAGENEAIAGVLEASVTSADPTIVVGTMRSEFDFIPLRPPLRDLSIAPR